MFWPSVPTPNHTLCKHSPSNLIITKLLTAFIQALVTRMDALTLSCLENLIQFVAFF